MENPPLPTSPDPICFRCSKPITPETAARLAGPFHMRCLARETQLDAIEQQDRASQARQRAADAMSRAQELVTRIRTHCPVCSEPFAKGRGVLFQGDQLVHAACWRAEPEATTGSSPSAEP
jgi:hypothetical protein